VLKYVPVMARPLVLGRTDHPTIWTPVYADVTDPKMTDWLWEQRECEEQKQRFLNRKYYNMEEQDRRFVKKQKRRHDQMSELQEYELMTSVSMPVFDRRENAVRFLFTHYFTKNVGEIILQRMWQKDDSRTSRTLSIKDSLKV
jgi:voltage-dependent calcium channel alpha-2/delta-3